MRYQVYFLNNRGKRMWLADCPPQSDSFGFNMDLTEAWKVIDRHIQCLNDLKIVKLKETYGDKYDEEKAKKSLFKKNPFYSAHFNEEGNELYLDVGSWSEFYIVKKMEEIEDA